MLRTSRGTLQPEKDTRGLAPMSMKLRGCETTGLGPWSRLRPGEERGFTPSFFSSFSSLRARAFMAALPRTTLSSRISRARPKSRVTLRKLGQGLKCKSPDKGASIFQRTLQGLRRTDALRFCQRQKRNHLRQMPSQLNLLCFHEQTQQFGFVRFEQLRLNGGDLFGGVGRSHPYDRVVTPQTSDKFGEALGRMQNELYDPVGAPDGSPVAASQQSCNRSAGHSEGKEKKWWTWALRLRASRLCLLATKIRRGDLHGAAHFVQS